MAKGAKPYKPWFIQKINNPKDVRSHCDTCKTKIEKSDDAFIINPGKPNQWCGCRKCYLTKVDEWRER